MHLEGDRFSFKDRLEGFAFVSSIFFVAANLGLDITTAVIVGRRFRAELPWTVLLVAAFALTWLIALTYLLYSLVKLVRIIERHRHDLGQASSSLTQRFGVQNSGLVFVSAVFMASALWMLQRHAGEPTGLLKLSFSR